MSHVSLQTEWTLV